MGRSMSPPRGPEGEPAFRSASWSRPWNPQSLSIGEAQPLGIVNVSTEPDLFLKCISEGIVVQALEPAQSVGEAQPPEIAMYSASTEPDVAMLSGEKMGLLDPKNSVGVARPPQIAEHSVTSFRYNSRKV